MRVNFWALKNVRLRLALEKAISAKDMKQKDAEFQHTEKLKHDYIKFGNQ